MENLSLQEIISILKPAIGARMLTQEQKDAYEQGLSILEGASNARSFIDNSRKFRDYHRRTRQMIAYLNSYSNSQVNAASSSATDKRRVGRPTKEEQAAYAELQKQKAMEEAKQSLFPNLKPDTTVQPLTYNGIVANPNGESIAATMPNLMQLRPYLSTALQEQVNTVRDLRSEMASKAEQAKTMAEANEKAISQGKGAIYTEEEIAAFATRATEIESELLPNIYTAVDREMGECYLRLSEKTGDPEYIAYAKKAFTIDPQTLRTQFKPFYEKALTHDPHHWRREVWDRPIQLTLAGHTHAGQLQIGKWTPARMAFKEWGGVYRKGSQMLNVSSGIGGSFPFRLGAWPEMTVITLKRTLK